MRAMIVSDATGNYFTDKGDCAVGNVWLVFTYEWNVEPPYCAASGETSQIDLACPEPDTEDVWFAFPDELSWMEDPSWLTELS